MLRLDDARRMIAAAENKALAIGRPMNIAVADEGGNLSAHAQSGTQFFGMHASNDGEIMIFAGGVLQTRDGKVVGAIGVSGGSGEQDQTVAEAGAAAF